VSPKLNTSKPAAELGSSEPEDYASNFGTYDDADIQKVLTALLPVSSLRGQDEVRRDGQRVATVLIPLVQRGDDWHVILTQRPDTMPSHPGQIAFPGGKREFGESTLNAALRETQEEIGIDRQFVTIIGRLPSFNLLSGYRVTPFVGLIDPIAQITPDPHEVADVFEVPLSFLMDAANHKAREVHFNDKDHTMIDMPYTDKDGVYRNIWGMTAMTLYRLYQRGFENNISTS